MVWRIEFDARALKELQSQDRQVQRRITTFLRERVAASDDPRRVGEALSGPQLGTFWKYRVGDWRIICNIDDKTITVLVLRIGHRREVYRS